MKIGFVIRAKDQTAKPKAKAESTNPEQLASDNWKVLDIGNWKQYLPALSLPTSIESPFRAWPQNGEVAKQETKKHWFTRIWPLKTIDCTIFPASAQPAEIEIKKPRLTQGWCSTIHRNVMRHFIPSAFASQHYVNTWIIANCKKSAAHCADHSVCSRFVVGVQPRFWCNREAMLRSAICCPICSTDSSWAQQWWLLNNRQSGFPQSLNNHSRKALSPWSLSHYSITCLPKFDGKWYDMSNTHTCPPTSPHQCGQGSAVCVAVLCHSEAWRGHGTLQQSMQAFCSPPRSQPLSNQTIWVQPTMIDGICHDGHEHNFARVKWHDMSGRHSAIISCQL